MWVSGLVCKILVVCNLKEDLQEKVDGVCSALSPSVAENSDGSMHVGRFAEVPLDDWDSFERRSHYFITHPTTFELPFNLLYPREKVYPPCKWCGGHGQDKSLDIDKEGC